MGVLNSIFDSSSFQPFAPSYQTQAPKSIWDHFLPDSDPGSVPASQSYGGMFGMGPMTRDQKVKMFISGLQDAVASARGLPANNLSDFQQSIADINARQRKALAQSKLTAALAGKNVDEIRSALLDYSNEGGDAKDAISASQFGRPKLEKSGEDIVSSPTWGDAPPTIVYSGKRPAAPGYMWDSTGTRQVYIPGGPADPKVAGVLAGAKRKPTAATAAAGALMFANPGTR